MSKTDLTCVKCAYHWDRTENLLEPQAVPQTGDLTLCLNCGQVYILGTSGWKLMSDKEIAQLPSADRADLSKLELGRKIIIREDLAFRQKFRKTE